MRAPFRLSTLILGLLLLAGACGGGEETPAADTASTVSAAAEPSASLESSPSDAAAGEDATPGSEATSAAAASDEPTASGTIRVGFIPGPYADMFREGVQPALEERGYQVEIEEISDFTIPNQATMDGDLDMTIFQNDAFLELFNTNQDGDLVSLLKVPSAPLGIYAGRGSAAAPEDIEDGAVVALTSEASNLARSLAFMESLGLVTVGEVAEGQLATQDNLTANTKNLSFELVDAPQVPRALPDVDYGVALGNHIYASGELTLNDALALEEVPEESQVAVTVREENAEADWAQAVVEVMQSDEFREFVEADDNFSAFHKPDWWE